MGEGSDNRDRHGTRLKHCTLCREPFEIEDVDDYGGVLDHWAREHTDTEEFWRVVGDAKTWTRCANCGVMFPSPISASHDGLTVQLYCDDCADNGLEDKIKALMVDDVTGRYVLDHEADGGHG